MRVTKHKAFLLRLGRQVLVGRADDPHLLEGLNVHAGQLTYYAVGKALGIDVISPQMLVKA